jgi:hypothetical protein
MGRHSLAIDGWRRWKSREERIPIIATPMDDVASPAFSDNTIAALRAAARERRTRAARRLDFGAILFAPSPRTRLCCSHESALARRRHAHAAASKNSTIAATAAEAPPVRERKNPCR